MQGSLLCVGLTARSEGKTSMAVSALSLSMLTVFVIATTGCISEDGCKRRVNRAITSERDTHQQIIAQLQAEKQQLRQESIANFESGLQAGLARAQEQAERSYQALEQLLDKQSAASREKLRDSIAATERANDKSIELFSNALAESQRLRRIETAAGNNRMLLLLFAQPLLLVGCIVILAAIGTWLWQRSVVKREHELLLQRQHVVILRPSGSHSHWNRPDNDR